MDSVNEPLGTGGEASRLRLSGLFDLDWQKALVVMLTLLVGAALAWVLWQIVSPIQHTLVLFALGAALAFVLSGPVQALSRRRNDRVFATLMVYLLVGGFILGAILLLAGPFVGQATDLGVALPGYASEFESRLREVQGTLGQYGIRTDVDQLEARATSTFELAATTVLNNLVGTVAGVGGAVVDVLLTLVISVYLLIDGPRFVERGMSVISPRHRPKFVFFQDNVVRILGGYLRGQLTLALIVGLGAGLGTAALGLPYAVVLGVLAGLFHLVPMIGSILSAAPAIIVALFMPFPTVVWVLLLFIIIEQLADNILAPRISGDAVGIHPLGVMFALLARVSSRRGVGRYLRCSAGWRPVGRTRGRLPRRHDGASRAE